MGALAVSWNFVMNASVYNSSLTSTETLVTLAYPVMDLAVVFFVFYSLLLRVGGRPFHKLIAAALIVMVVADLADDLLVLHAERSVADSVGAGS